MTTTVVNIQRAPVPKLDYDVYIGRHRDSVWRWPEQDLGSPTGAVRWLPGGAFVIDRRDIKPGEAGYLGNPVVLGRPCPLCGEKHRRAGVAGALRCYRIYLYRRLARDDAFRAVVHALRGKRLGCYCAPEACHGDVLAAVADGRDGCFLCGRTTAATYVHYEGGARVCGPCYRGAA